MNPAQNPLVVDRVRKAFASVVAVDDLSFEVRPSEIFALLGPNGAGKTTTVRMLVDILRPDSGSIRFSLGDRAGHRVAAADLGYLPEERGLHRDAPILATLEYFGVLHGLPRATARERALAGLAHWDLEGRGKDRVDSLSKGNQQKIQFLAATLHRPRFVVLDEPFSGLDPINQQRFVEEIRGLRDGGGTVVLSAHQMDLVESIADRVLVMDQGAAVLHGTLDQIRTSAASGLAVRLGLDSDLPPGGVPAIPGVRSVEARSPREVTLVLEPDLAVGPVLHALTAELEVSSVETQRESLRDIYLRTVGRPRESLEETA